MNALIALILVGLAAGVAWAGVGGANLRYLFGVIVPYAAISLFLIGLVYKIFSWAKAPVPFRIVTTTGQQKSHAWIHRNRFEAPHYTWEVIVRMALEVLLFRSLFRNTKAELREGPRLVYGSTKILWLFGLAFHWMFLLIFVRHFVFFAEPVPNWILTIQSLDGFFQIGLPVLYLSDLVFVAALSYLVLRRVLNRHVRYISLVADYFPVLLILAIACTGILMRYTSWRVDITDVKLLATSLVTFAPTVPASLGTLFFVHLFLVSVLLIYFPTSKLMHMPGVFMSPTRNLANNSRERRHINPWNPVVKTHTYEEWEDEFREVMKAADMPVEKE
jgi:nitrate reductase gamma subunit